MNWIDDKVHVKLVNVDYPGEDIPISVQGKPYIFADGFTGWVPRLVKDAIDDAVFWEHDRKSVNINKGELRKKVLHHRFLAVSVEPPLEKKPDEKAKDKLIDDIKDTKPKMKKSFGSIMSDRKKEEEPTEEEA